MDVPQSNPILPLPNLGTSHVDQLSSVNSIPRDLESLVPEDLSLSKASTSGPADDTPFSTPAGVMIEQFKPMKTETPTIETDKLVSILPRSESPSPPNSPLVAPSYHFEDSEGPGSEEGRLSSENGVLLGHGSEEGGINSNDLNAAVLNGKKVDAGRRRSGTGLDMPVLEEPTLEEYPFKKGKGKEIESLEAEDSLEPLAVRNSPNQASTFSSTSNSTLEPINRISNPRAHSRTQSLASPRPVGSLSTTTEPLVSLSLRPSTSTTPLTGADSPRRRPSASAESSKTDKIRKEESEERKKEREKEKEKERDSTRSRRVLGEWTMSKTLGAGSMGKVKLGISSITGEKVCLLFLIRWLR